MLALSTPRRSLSLSHAHTNADVERVTSGNPRFLLSLPFTPPLPAPTPISAPHPVACLPVPLSQRALIIPSVCVARPVFRHYSLLLFSPPLLSLLFVLASVTQSPLDFRLRHPARLNFVPPPPPRSHSVLEILPRYVRYLSRSKWKGLLYVCWSSASLYPAD